MSFSGTGAPRRGISSAPTEQKAKRGTHWLQGPMGLLEFLVTPWLPAPFHKADQANVERCIRNLDATGCSSAELARPHTEPLAHQQNRKPNLKSNVGLMEPPDVFWNFWSRPPFRCSFALSPFRHLFALFFREKSFRPFAAKCQP